MHQHEQLLTYCKSLRLPTMAEVLPDTLARAGREAWSLETALLLLEQEVERRRRRIERFLRESQLPPGKTLAHFDQRRLPLRIHQRLPQLEQGDFVDRCENLLFFGLPGTGKTHCAVALGHALVQQGRSVLFIPTFKLVGRLLTALYGALILEFLSMALLATNVVLVDQAGQSWNSRDMYESLALVSLFSMLFVTCLCFIKVQASSRLR